MIIQKVILMELCDEDREMLEMVREGLGIETQQDMLSIMLMFTKKISDSLALGGKICAIYPDLSVEDLGFDAIEKVIHDEN